MGVIGRREQAKEGRRQKIIDAAMALIEEDGSTDFSMKQLGERAGLSPFTTYNLIGNKAAVLFVLLNRSLAEVDAGTRLMPLRDDPVAFFKGAGEVAVTIFTARPRLYRPLFAFLLGSPEAEHRPAYMRRAAAFWRFACAPMAKAGLFKAPITTADFAHDALMFFTGVLEFWVHEELSQAEFLEQVRHGFALRLLTLDIPGTHAALASDIEAARPGIERFSGI